MRNVEHNKGLSLSTVIKLRATLVEMLGKVLYVYYRCQTETITKNRMYRNRVMTETRAGQDQDPHSQKTLRAEIKLSNLIQHLLLAAVEARSSTCNEQLSNKTDNAQAIQ